MTNQTPVQIVKAELNAQIIEQLKVNPSLRDLHNGGKVMRTVDAVVLFEVDDITHVCMVFPGNICCLNPLWLQDGEVVLETGSVGGNVDARYCSLEEAVEKYNETHGGKITKIIDLKG